MVVEQHGWERLGGRVVFEGRVRLVEHDVLLPDGERSTYLVDESLSCAVATLLQVDDRFALTYQYRYPLDRWILDLPGGGCDRDESPKSAGARECPEELGLVPEDLVPLVTYFANPGRAAWPVHVFSSTAYHERRRTSTDAAELVHRRLLRREEVDDLIAVGEVVDPTLLIAWQAAHTRILI